MNTLRILAATQKRSLQTLETLAEVRKENEELTLRLEAARLALENYQEYRRMNTLNFQLEKADSYIKAIEVALTPEA